MRGNRFPALTYEEMNLEQKEMTNHILSGERGTMDGPYNVLLRSPVIGNLAQQFGASLRFRSSLPKRLTELAILMTARHWNSEFEWYVHHQFALKAGLDRSIIHAISIGGCPESMQPDEAAVFNFCMELLNNKIVSDETFLESRRQLNEVGVVDLIGLLSYYHLVSMVLNVDGYPLPENPKQEFMLPPRHPKGDA
jgi:4-carboxymuconolactone decarboxylase